MNLCANKLAITVGARASPLSKVQCWEVLSELQKFYPHVEFIPEWIVTTGDLDLKTSLRTLEKTDFFTKEIDSRQLKNQFRISIHSAKDLPDPLPDGLTMVALTRGQSALDVLVVKEGVTLETLTGKVRIATSSIRREEEIKRLLPDAEIVDIRGTIEARLAKLDSGLVDGIVMAKAALIRLKLDYMNQIILSGPIAQFQGQLAVIARSTDPEMAALFSPLDTRKKVLYVGLTPPQKPEWNIVHHPLIETRLLTLPTIDMECTHIIITSKTAATYLAPILPKDKVYISVGQSTTKSLQTLGITNIRTAQTESQEGVIDLIKTLQEPSPHFFWAHSSLSRPCLRSFLQENNFSLIEHLLYDTLFKKPESSINFDTIDAIYFSSSSTLDAFFTFYKELPDKEIITQGPVTKNYLTMRYSHATTRKIATTSV